MITQSQQKQFDLLKTSKKKNQLKMMKMKNLAGIIMVLLAITGSATAQKNITKNARIRFYSETPMEKIEAINNQVNSALDVSTGDFVFKVLIKSFEFEKALMQEHFNENYMESGKYPNATFSGKISNFKDINFSKDGSYNATVEGNLTMHGVTKKVTEKGTIEVKGGKIVAKSTFNIKPQDYNISIPGAVVAKIAEYIQVNVDATLEKHGI
jgi:polyisoprenoid-binding protein YceI